MGGVLRHELGELVDLAERHLEHAADVAQHAAGEERAEGDDLRHAVGAVAVAHVGDHLVAPLLAEVDVEVRHGHALGVQEALEQEREPHRVEVGDGQRPGDQRARARAAARADRNAVGLRPFDEVGDDEKVAGKLHLDDDVEFEREAAVVVFAGMTLREAEMGEPRLEPLARLPAEFLDLVHRFAARRREMRQDRLAGQRPVGAAHRNLDARLQRLGQVGEERDHLGAGLETVLGREPPALLRRDERPLGDAEEGVVRLVVGQGCEIGLVGRDQRQPAPVGEVDQRRLGRDLGLDPMTLQFDVEPVAEGGGKALEARLCKVGHVRAERPVDRAVRTAGERDEAVRADEGLERDMGFVAFLRVEPKGGDEPHERAIADLGLAEEHDRGAGEAKLGETRSGGGRIAEIDRDLGADDRLDAALGELFREFQGAEQVVGVGDRQRRHGVGLGELGERLDRQRALPKGKGAVDMQVDETDRFEDL